MNNQSKVFPQIASAYIMLPFLIFVLGWIKLWIAIPMVLVLVICYWKASKDSPEIWFPEINRENIVKILFAAGIIAIWVYYSGIGKFVFQNEDHTIRNGIFNILVEYEWPVINHEILPGELNSLNINVTGLVYYIGFWLPSAIVGKILGIRAGYYAQAVWAFIGIFLIYFLICTIFRKVVLWPLFVLIFFSGLDCIGIFLTNIDPGFYDSKWHLEWWGTPYQYSSMTTQLFWTFNQSIPAWLCTILVYVQKSNRNLILILSCSMLTSTFPFVGLLPLVFFFCFTRRYEGKRYFTEFVKDTCTIQNVLGGGVIGITTFLYLNNNISSGQIMEENTRGYNFENSLAKLILFLVLDIGVYCVLIYKYNKDNKLYYFIILCLCIIPPIKIGHSIDFCMRASIPALFILMILVIETLYKSWNVRDYRVFAGLLLVLLLGSATPICEMRRTFTMTFERIREGIMVEAEDEDSVSILNKTNFVGDIEKSVFFKYLAK